VRLTLIELLVLLAIAAILLGLTLPGLSRSAPRGWGARAAPLAAPGLLLFSAASVLARLLLLANCRGVALRRALSR
jgi:hypothetical protein